MPQPTRTPSSTSTEIDTGTGAEPAAEPVLAPGSRLSYDRVRWDADHTPRQWAAIAEALDNAQRGNHQEAGESFERCDTDGFVSQWASGVSAAANQEAAALARAHGLAEFPVLLHADDGTVASVDRRSGQWGMYWVLNQAARDRLPADAKGIVGEPNCKTHAREVTNLARKGYRIATMRARGRVELTGGGSGLSGALSVYPVVRVIRELAQAGHYEITAQTAPWHERAEERDAAHGQA